MRDIGALILAAGRSARFGRAKQFLVFERETLLRRVAKGACAAGCGQVVVVTGDAVEQVRAELHDLPVHIVQNQDWQRGLGTSIKCGVAQLRNLRHDLHAIVILACDQPFVSSETIKNLLATNAPIVASAYAGTVGIPALFESRHFDALAALPDDCGAKALIIACSEDVVLLPFPEGAIDIDTPADYAALCQDNAKHG